MSRKKTKTSYFTRFGFYPVNIDAGVCTLGATDEQIVAYIMECVPSYNASDRLETNDPSSNRVWSY